MGIFAMNAKEIKKNGRLQGVLGSTDNRTKTYKRVRIHSSTYDDGKVLNWKNFHVMDQSREAKLHDLNSQLSDLIPTGKVKRWPGEKKAGVIRPKMFVGIEQKGRLRRG